MDVYDSLDKSKRKENLDTYNKFRSAAKKYSSHGFDEDSIAELLQIDGCPINISEKLASDVMEDLPPYYEEGPPISYEDVKENVEKTILNTPLDELELYFRQHASSNMECFKRIAAVRVCPSKVMLDEVHKDLEPLVENLILSNKASIEAGNMQKMSSKEKIEKDLFGVWPIEYLNDFKNRQASEENLVKKASKKGDKPIILF